MNNDLLKKLRLRIVDLFRKFSTDPHHSPLKKQKDREMVGRLIDRIHTTTFDTSILPYYSVTGMAKHHNKAECVFALMCDIIISYWQVAEGGAATDIFVKNVEDKLKRLNTVYAEYDSLKILGDTKGYCLFASQLPKSKKETKDVGKEDSPASQEGSQEKTDEGTEGTTTEVEEQVESSTQGIRHKDLDKAMVDNLPELSEAQVTEEEFGDPPKGMGDKL